MVPVAESSGEGPTPLLGAFLTAYVFAVAKRRVRLNPRPGCWMTFSTPALSSLPLELSPSNRANSKRTGG